jgi:ubiquitin thioesterase OTU1
MIRLEVEDDTTLKTLLSLIKEKTELSKFTLKYGWPPRDWDVDTIAPTTTVQELNIKGETIVVVPSESATAADVPAHPVEQAPTKESFRPKAIEPDETVVEWTDRSGYMGRLIWHSSTGL